MGEREHRGECGDPVGRQLIRGQGRNQLRATLDPRERLVVDDDGDPVAREPDIELEPVAAAEVERRDEGRDRVLGHVSMITAVRETECPRGEPVLRRHDANPISRWAASPRWSEG